MVVSLLGLKCIKIGSAGDQTKAKMAGTGGILAILGGTWAWDHTWLKPGLKTHSKKDLLSLFNQDQDQDQDQRELNDKKWQKQ